MFVLNSVVFRGVFFLYASSLSAGRSVAYLFVRLDDKQFCMRLASDSLDSARSLTLSLSQKILCVNVMKSTFQLKPFCVWKKAECLIDSQIFAALSVVVVVVCAVFPHCTTTKSERNRNELQAWIQHTDTAYTQIHSHTVMCSTHTSTKSITATITTTTTAVATAAAAVAIAVSCTLSLPYIEPFQWWIRRKPRFVPQDASIDSVSTIDNYIHSIECRALLTKKNWFDLPV